MNVSDNFLLPIPENDMPPIPLAGEKGPHVCDTIQLYLAILEELSPEQAQLVLEHVDTCSNCAEVQQQMQQATLVLKGLPESTPSERVDRAVMKAITARSKKRVTADAHDEKQTASIDRNQPVMAELSISQADSRHPPSGRRKRIIEAACALALAATLVLALMASLHFGGWPAIQTFALPSNLSWNGYVLYHTETRFDAKGERYQVNTYHDLGTGRMHVETVMPGSMDVVVVGNEHIALGLDMMHHVAQWNAEAWRVDETPFNLAQLRSDLATQRAVYLDKATFQGQPVYRIRYRNGMILLLDMNYHPVNVLRSAVGPDSGKPMYDTLMLMPDSHVASSMWDMSVPNGFRMGTLPDRP
ncbi:MAG: anti-sigma factor family protein [Ktedonobacteraceae bacterium]